MSEEGEGDNDAQRRQVKYEATTNLVAYENTH